MRYAVIMLTPGEPSNLPVAGDHRLRRIESVTDAALAHLNVEDLLVELLTGCGSFLRWTPPPCCCSMPPASSWS
jgi:hypothetical protein